MTAGDPAQPVEVAFAADRVEAEMIQGLLESNGIPSSVQQVGVDGPTLGFGLLNPGGGQRRVMVRADHRDAALAVLAETFTEGEPERWHDEIGETDSGTGGGRARDYGLIGGYARALFWSLLAMGLILAAFLLTRGL